MFFRKKPKGPQFNFHVFYDRVSKYRQIFPILDSLSPNQTNLVIAFFEDTESQVKQLLAAKGMTFSSSASEIRTGLTLINAQRIDDVLTSSVERVICMDIHPLSSITREIKEKFQNTSISEIIVYTSLDEAIIQSIGAENIRNILKSLGLKDSESISHAMVNKSILKAMEKLEKKISHPKDVRSNQEDWMRANIPGIQLS